MTSGATGRGVADAARIYSSLRTAHLERFAEMTPAEVLYVGTRSDFDESLVDPANPPRRMTSWQVIRRVVSHEYAVIEVNEPASVERWPFLLVLTLAIRLAGLVRRRRARVVSYCIGNADLSLEIRDRWRLPTWAGRLLAQVVMSLLVIGTDRLAFGTSGSLDMYRDSVGSRRLDRRSRLFEGIPSPCGCAQGHHEDRIPDRLLFVGTFVERKGIEPTMAVWEEVRRRRAGATFAVIGHGRLQEAVSRWSIDRPEVLLSIDPPRSEIHRSLREASALILLSQPHRHWREQIGLPILEGLSHGCEIIATTETGLAGWLVDHGHAVVAPDATPDEVAGQVLSALDRARARHGSLADLPSIDQRIAADHWMFSPAGDRESSGLG
jgi:glycosyltransferase involved in cell wall biosynthesis